MEFKEVEFDESRYPMSYEEFEKRVIELLLENYTGAVLEDMKIKVENELSNDIHYTESFYGDACFTYDHPELYGETCKKEFEDFYLQRHVNNLRMLIE
jgi:hypothetical protein